MDYALLIIGTVLGFIIGWFFARSKNTSNSGDAALQSTLNTLDKEKSVLQERLNIISAEKEKTANELKQEQQKAIESNKAIAAYTEQLKHKEEALQLQKQEAEALQKKFATEFENIANRILDEKSKKFTEQNKTNMEVILNPLKENLKNFEEKVEKTYKAESTERITLKTEIKNLLDLNKQLSTDATNLTNALKGDKKLQGNWGEDRLEQILQIAGLQEGIHYNKQVSMKDEEGKSKQPDFVINLPEGKHLIVDSKVSLNAYTAYFNNTDEEQKKILIKTHIDNIKNHIKDLSGKNYQGLYQINSPDYVLMYIPIEPAFTLAIEHEPDLVLWALENRKVVLVTTSTLLATLSTVSFIWKQENQRKNIQEIVRQGGDLYEKFVGFVEDLISVGKSIESSRTNYQQAMNKLVEGKGNLVNRVQNLKKLGVHANKSLPDTIIQRAEEDTQE